MVTVKSIPGISATIYRQSCAKKDRNGHQREYVSFMVAYSLLGKLRREHIADLDKAVEAGKRFHVGGESCRVASGTTAEK